MTTEDVLVDFCSEPRFFPCFCLFSVLSLDFFPVFVCLGFVCGHASSFFLYFWKQAGADVDVHAAHGRKAGHRCRGKRPSDQGRNDVLQIERERGMFVLYTSMHLVLVVYDAVKQFFLAEGEGIVASIYFTSTVLWHSRGTRCHDTWQKRVRTPVLFVSALSFRFRLLRRRKTIDHHVTNHEKCPLSDESISSTDNRMY